MPIVDKRKKRIKVKDIDNFATAPPIVEVESQETELTIKQKVDLRSIYKKAEKGATAEVKFLSKYYETEYDANFREDYTKYVESMYASGHSMRYSMLKSVFLVMGK